MLRTTTIFDRDDAPEVSTSGPHQITEIKAAVRSPNRANIFVDDKFFCSLDITQVVDFSLKVGKTLDAVALTELKQASDFGKLYGRALEYVFLRPHSTKEIRDYLQRKTLDRRIRVKNAKTGEYETKIKKGFDKSLVPLVLERLNQHGYLDDRKFAEFWLENHHARRGSSTKKLRQELLRKGVAATLIDELIAASDRNDTAELKKILAKKAAKYPDEQKLIQYLLRQGFNYSDILDALSSASSSIGE